MARKILHSARSGLWELVREQHGVIARRQLLALGYTASQIDQRIKMGRLHRLFTGVYAVGRPEVTPEGWWMAAVLASGEDALLSHDDGAALYGIRPKSNGAIHVSVPPASRRCHPGIVAHRRALTQSERTHHRGIPVVAVAVVLADLAAGLTRGPLEAAINEADARGLIAVPRLREEVGWMPRRAGRRPLLDTLDRRTFRFTRSQLERAFIQLALDAGLPRPETRQVVCGWEVDFFWPALGLVVETDGLTYHRTPRAQARDRLRDQAHLAAGLTPLRFTHSQIRYEPGYVSAMLATVARRLARAEQVGRQLHEVGHG